MPTESYFTSTSSINLFLKRLQRLNNFKRLLLFPSLKIIFIYFKKMIGLTATKNDTDLNYYFLTLINCNCFSLPANIHYFNFKTTENLKFTARRNSSSDLEVFNQIWGRKEYSKATDIVKKNSAGKKDLIIIDAGANVGYTSLFFRDNFPFAKIYSIEPDENNFMVFEKNILINNAQNIIPLNYGLWDSTCNLQISRDYRDGRDWSIQVKETTEETNLKAIGVHDLLTKYGITEIDLFKIDIEGAEARLFKNAEYAHKFLSITKVLAIEIHDENVSRNYIYQILTENNFSYFDYNDLTIAYKNTSS